MKRSVSILIAAVLALSMTATAFAGSHGGRHHSGKYYGNQATNARPSTSYKAPAAICVVYDCTTIGEHTHNGGVVTHYYGDGHSYHTQDFHAYHEGAIHH